MLIVRALEDIPDQGIIKGETFRLYIVDTHHHMGREKSHRNTPGGAYDFYQLLWFEMKRLVQQAIEDNELLFEPIEIIAPPFQSRMFDSRKSWKSMNHGWLVDRTVVFPYTDDYSKRGDNGEPSFKISNDKIAGWTTRAPHSSRLIGFGRVDPCDAKSGPADAAVRELDRAILQLGLRGLKLHPLAQLFIDDLEDDITKRVLHRAAELQIPVIFDTRNMRTAIRIKKLIDTMREEEAHTNVMSGLNIILAHCGMSPGDPKLHDILKDPNFTADTSTLHDQDLPLLFQMASTRIKSSAKRWSESLLFGTDYSFLSVQAAELIIYTFSRSFPGTLADTQRILGGNALSLIQRPFRTNRTTKRSPRQLACPSDGGTARAAVETALISLIRSAEWELSSMDTMLPPKQTWPQPLPESKGGFNGIYTNSILATLRAKDVDYEIHLWLRDNPGNILTLAALGTKGEDALTTTEYATHRIGECLIEELTKNTRHEHDASSLVNSIPKLFG